MVSLLLIGSAVTTAVLLALAARLSSLVSTLLVTYLAFTANLGLVTIALSPFQAVTRAGLGAAEAVLLVSAAAVWWVRGRPAPPLGLARTAAREVVTDLPTAAFLAFVLVLLGYELLLGLTVPQNNTDALAYHLARAAAWAQHGGVYWIPDAPTIRMDAFQPFAEQQLLFLLVAVRGGRLVALPQYLAELAALIGGLRIGATNRLLGTPGSRRGLPPRDVLPVRAPGDHGPERHRGGLVPGRRGLPSTGAGTDRAAARRHLGRHGPRREAHHGARAAGPRLAGGTAGPAAASRPRLPAG